jgi:hypothetical protein
MHRNRSATRQGTLCEQVAKLVETGHKSKLNIFWNQREKLDRTIPNNQPDIIIRYDKKGTHILLAIAISRDINVIKAEAEKILKYVDLKTEVQRLWNIEAK